MEATFSPLVVATLAGIFALAIGAAFVIGSEGAARAGQELAPWADPELAGPAQDIHTCPLLQTGPVSGAPSGPALSKSTIEKSEKRGDR